VKEKEINIKLKEYTKEEFSSNEFNNLVEQSVTVLENAYAPYSLFSVGAAVLLENGEIITGTNQENAAYPSGLCAERVAMFYANSKFPDVAVKAIAVSAKYKGQLIKQIIPPCGSCRQVLLETETRFKKPIKVILASDKNLIISDNVKQLLPLNFDDNFLK
jgi:cytidine deaminase